MMVEFRLYFSCHCCGKDFLLEANLREQEFVPAGIRYSVHKVAVECPQCGTCYYWQPVSSGELARFEQPFTHRLLEFRPFPVPQQSFPEFAPGHGGE